MTKKAILSWSGGKDSALALHEIQNTDNYEIHGLLTTVNEDFERISIHGVRQRARVKSRWELLTDEGAFKVQASGCGYEGDYVFG